MAVIVVFMSVLVLVPISMLMFVRISMFMLVPIAVVMLAAMVMFVSFSMPMGVLFPFCIFWHGMAVIMVTVLMLIVVLVVVITQFGLLGVMLNALIMTVCCLMLVHGCGSSDCAPMLALNVEVGYQRLCFSAKDLLEV